jgi:hypothetical protein
MRRGEQLAFLRRIKAPKRVHRGERIRLRVTMQRVRDGNLTRTYRVRIPRHIKPGRRVLTLRGFDQSSPDDALLELLLGDVTDESPEGGPNHLSDLIDEIHHLGVWDGVTLRMAGHRKRAFKDNDLVITGRAHATVRVVR